MARKLKTKAQRKALRSKRTRQRENRRYRVPMTVTRRPATRSDALRSAAVAVLVVLAAVTVLALLLEWLS